MADKLKVEIQEKDVNVPMDLKNDLSKFKNEIETKAKEVKQQKTLAEAQKVLDGAQISVDYKDLALQIGGVILKFDTRPDLDAKIFEIENDLKAINSELASLELDLRRDQQKVVDENKATVKNLSDDVNDNTATEIDFTQKIKEKSWLGTFLTGTTTLEKAIDDKNSAEAEAFRKTLLEALVKGKSEYEKVKKDGGTATFNKKEWYTLQFIEAHQDALSKKEKNIDWLKLKKEYDGGLIGLDANGEPVEKIGKTVVNTTEKTYEQMTQEEKVNKAREAMETLKGMQMVQERDPVTGKSMNVINITSAQLIALQSVSDMGGPDFGYEAVGYEPTRADRRNDRMVEKTQNLMNRGKYERALKSAEKTNDVFTGQRKALQKINAYSQNFANERNRASYNKNVANNAMNLAKGPGYAGVTMDVIPYAPLFTNICQNVRSLSDRGHLTMDVIGIGPVQVRCPERYNLAFGNAFNGVANQYGLDGQYAFSGQNEPRGINMLESFITKNTRMNTEQAKGLTNGLLLGGGAFLLFKSMKWLFTGEWKSKKALKDTFRGRAALIGGGLWGANKLSQLGTGQNLFDVMKGLYTGKMTFQDLWKGTYAKYDKNSPEYQAGTNQAYNQAFRNVPYGMMLPFVEKGSDGYPKVKDVYGLINQLKILEGQTTDRNQKAAIRSQITFLESLSTDPNGKNILNEAFVNMGIDYKKMSENKDGNGNEVSDKMTERIKKYTDYLTEKGRILKGNKESQDKQLQHFQTGKPTLEDMVKDGCFAKSSNINGKSVSDPFVDIGPDGKEIQLDPDTKLDAELRDVDLPLAKQLYVAKNSLLDNGIDAKFVLEKGKMFLKSYEMITPIQYDNGGWYIGGESSGNATDRLPVRFDNAEHALRVANLTNRLIHLYSGKYSSVNKPFSAAGSNKDLMVGKAGTLIQRFADTTAIESPTAKKLGGALFSDQIQGYANYLNGIHNTSGESIWNEKGKVGYDNRSSYLERWANKVNPLPKRKDSDKFTGTGKTDDVNKTKTTPDNTNTDAIKDKLNATTETNKTNLVIEDTDQAVETLIKSRAIEWKKKHDPYYKAQIGKEMPIEFYEAWSKAYGKTGNYKIDFIYANTPYRRQGGDLPPTRHIDKAKKSWQVGNLK